MHRPNLILLVLDSVRAANVSCYGYHRPTTPNLDRLAAEASLYEQAISVGCWTLPVHVSMFTGLYPYQHGVNISAATLSGQRPTLAGQLRSLGYQTACFSNNPYISQTTGLIAGFDTVEDMWQASRPRGIRRTKASQLIKTLQRYGRITDPAVWAIRSLRKLVKRARPKRDDSDSGAALTNSAIEDWLAQRQTDRPFFLFANYMECHQPYRAPAPYDRRFMDRRVSERDIHRLTTDLFSTMDEGRLDRQSDREILRSLYDGALAYLDERVGQLVRALESAGILDDTVLVITSDHGDSLGEHGRFGHRTELYEQLVHVPLLIRYPACFRGGDRVRPQVQLIDLYPTLLELAGAEIPPEVLRSSQSLLAPPETWSRPFAVAENTGTKSQQGVLARMIRTEQYKYIWKSDGDHELYNLRADPGEEANLVGSETEVADDLQRQLTEWLDGSSNDRELCAAQTQYDAVVLERLRDLGYVE
jgi:arylsulfatase A-like enzyme